MSSSKTTILITGANRGIGKGIAANYLKEPNNVVVAAVRATSPARVAALQALPVADGSKLVVVPLDISSSASIMALPKELAAQGIDALDIVVSNAALGDSTGPLSTTSRAVLTLYLETNAYGPLELYQVTRPLLLQSASPSPPKIPKFCVVSSRAGQFSGPLSVDLPTGAYSTSKILLNGITKRLSLENADIVTWPVHPGFVGTDMGNTAVEMLTQAGIDVSRALPPMISPQESADALKAQIDWATLENVQGKFLNYDNTELEW